MSGNLERQRVAAERKGHRVPSHDISVLSSSCGARSLSRDKESEGMGANARRSHSDEQVARMMMKMTLGGIL